MPSRPVPSCKPSRVVSQLTAARGSFRDRHQHHRSRKTRSPPSPSPPPLAPRHHSSLATGTGFCPWVSNKSGYSVGYSGTAPDPRITESHELLKTDPTSPLPFNTYTDVVFRRLVYMVLRTSYVPWLFGPILADTPKQFPDISYPL